MLLTVIYLIGFLAACELHWFNNRRIRKEDRPPFAFSGMITALWPISLIVIGFDKIMTKVFGSE